MTRLLLALALAFPFVPAAHAASGELSFNASGADGGWGGGDGEDAGDVTLHLEYADAAKTQVSVSGQIVHHGRVTAIRQAIALADLKSITVSAVGGDGGRGTDGRDGSDGSDGRNGFDGCPPGNGSDGGNGGNGSDGGHGGDGGRGGVIHVSVDGSQSELLLYTKIHSAPGSAGSGGTGGRAGRGGEGGRGGRNNCRHSHGNPTHGPDGRDGRDGWSGRSGNSGSSGRAGANGSQSYDVTDAGGTVSYPRPFALQLSGVKAVDENEDTVLEPGEPLHLLQLVVTNTGPMPTPTGQALNLLLRATSTLGVVQVPPVAITETLAGGASKTLTFARGEAVLRGADDARLIGQKALIGERVAINNVNLDTANEAGFTFHWPVGVDAAADGTRAYFGATQNMRFSLHNVSSKDVGPGGVQAAEVVFEWVSATVPAADVTVTLPGGRALNLATPQSVPDFTIPARSQLPLPLGVKVANSKNLLTASGKLKVSVKLQSFVNPGQDTVDFATTSLFLALDLRPFAINHEVAISKRTTCNYPDRVDNQPLESPVTTIYLFKDRGSDRMGIKYKMDGMVSQAYSVDAWDFAIYTDLTKTNPHPLVLAFLNNMLAGLTARGDVFWHFSGCHSL